ncbi:MAG: glycosyltransferase, partial [Actinomycetota bacterium]|nr:glycosyltransferase [Actinomycetota bacterium]
DESSILLCPNAVDIGRMQRLAAEPNVAFPREADIRVVAVARLVPQKALDVLIQALSELPTEAASWECFLLGEGPLEKELKAQATELGVADRIRFVGVSENPAAWIESADIFVLPSAWEPFGIVLLEAMSLGIAVITSDSDGAREVVTDEKDALVFPTGDVEALKDRLLELSRDGSRRSQLGENARQTATRYDSESVAATFGSVISSIVATAQDRHRVMDGLRDTGLWKRAKGKLWDTYFWDVGIWPLKAKQRREWIRRGRPKKVPHLEKEKVVRAHARSFGTGVLVETGTFHGEMVSAMRKRFEQIYSIELHPELHQKATQRFHRFSHIQILKGDSAQLLPEIAAEIEESCLFWLDAHYSGGITARGGIDTPISAELQTVLGRRQSDVVLIDDSFDFNGSSGYPTLAELENAVKAARPDYDFTVSDYIIRITPSAGNEVH